MPVTARLSKLFYDRIGEQVANELVDWFNQVDATYRADFRELNEMNFARFDAKLEQRIAQAEAKIDQRFAQFEVKVEQRLAQFEVKIEQRVADLRTDLVERMAKMERRLEVLIERRIGEQNRYFLGMWITTMLAFLGLYLRR